MPLGVLVSLTVTSIRGRLASERKVTARSGSVNEAWAGNEACAGTLVACWRAAAAPASDLSQMDCALTSANAPCDNARGARMRHMRALRRRSGLEWPRIANPVTP